MAVFEIPVIDAPHQRLSTFLSDQSVTIELFWNATSARWALSLTVADTLVLQGRRLVPDVDLLSGYGLDLGRLFLVDWAGKGGQPGRSELPAGEFRLIHDDGVL